MKLNFNVKEILQKEFKLKFRGYHPDEVDEFLDNIIKDYEIFDKEIFDLQKENSNLLIKISELKEEIKNLNIGKNVLSISDNFKIDILKRLKKLEEKNNLI